MHVALLMNFVAPYRVPLLEALRDRVGRLSVLISVPMEKDRNWVPDWGTLDVQVQRNVVLHRTYRDATGFSRQLEIHVPFDTLPRLVRSRPDAVISGELGMRSLQCALYKLVRPGMPFLIWATLSEHSERGWGWARRALRRFILRRADGVLVNGESGARYIAGFGLPDGSIVRVNQPVDVDVFVRQPRVRNERAGTRLLFSGMLVPRKGLMPFAAALADWCGRHPERSVEMWWLGGGELRGPLEALALPANLSFRFLGERPYAALPEVYAQADLLAFPTLLDEWGLVVNEAMASGMPVLGSIYSQAVEELVEEGRTGWLFDPLDPASLSAGIDRALNTPPDALPAMRQAARNAAVGLNPTNAGDIMAEAVRAAAGRLRRGRRPERGSLPAQAAGPTP